MQTFGAANVGAFVASAYNSLDWSHDWNYCLMLSVEVRTASL